MNVNPLGYYVAIAASTILLGACGSPKDANEKNLGKAIQAYLDTLNGACAVSQIPADNPTITIEANSWIPSIKNQADALTAAGILASENLEIDRKDLLGKVSGKTAATRYTLTENGKKYAKERPGLSGKKLLAFCTGHQKLIKINNFTEPADMLGVRASQVNYTYHLTDADNWIKQSALQKAFPDVGRLAAQELIQGQAALVLTNEGWIHEKLFKR